MDWNWGALKCSSRAWLKIYTRFECGFTVSFSPVLSVILHLLHSFRVCFYRGQRLINLSTTLMGSGSDCTLTAWRITKLHLLDSFRVWIYIFSTRFECGFTSSRLVSSVVLPSEDGSVEESKTTPGESIRVILLSSETWKYTRNEWRRLQKYTLFECIYSNLLQLSSYASRTPRLHGPLSGKTVDNRTFTDIWVTNDTNLEKHTRNEWRRYENTLESSGEDIKTHSKRVEKMQENYTNRDTCLCRWVRCPTVVFQQL